MEKFNFCSKLSAACTKDTLRPVLQCVHFKDGFAYASDGHVVIRQTLEISSVLDIENLNGHSIHKDCFDLIRKFDIAKATENGIECSDNEGGFAIFEYHDLKGVQMPNFDSVLKIDETKPVSFIGINPTKLKQIIDAMHSDTNEFRLTFQGMDKGIIVETLDIDNQIALVMPVMLQQNLFKSE